MKKTYLLLILVVIMIVLGTNTVFAADSILSLTGSAELKPGETSKIAVKVLSTDKEIGVVSGKISATTNITDISCSGLNGWTVTYNSSTGEFNAYKAQGIKDGEIFEVNYKLQENAQNNASITMTSLKATTVDYTTKNVSDITKK